MPPKYLAALQSWGITHTGKVRIYGSSTHACMILILDGNSEIGRHVRSNISDLICLRPSIGSRAVTNRIFFLRRDKFSFMRAQHIRVMI